MSRILIIAEHDGATLNISTAKCVSCAQAIGGDIDIAVMGQGIDPVAETPSAWRWAGYAQKTTLAPLGYEG